MKKQVFVFLVLAFGITWSLDALMIINKAWHTFLVIPAMWGPGLAAIITSLVFYKSLRPLGLALKNLQYLPAGYLLPLLYALPVYSATWFFGFAAFNSGFQWKGPSDFLIGHVQSLLVAAGMELGWRGFLYPGLSGSKGRFHAALVTGILSAAWWLPSVIINHQQGSPLWWVLSCFSFMTISLGFLAAWLRDKSGNIWPAILLTASHHFYITYFLDPLTKASRYREYVTGEFGIGLALSTFLLATLLWLKHEKMVMNQVKLVRA